MAILQAPRPEPTVTVPNSNPPIRRPGSRHRRGERTAQWAPIVALATTALLFVGYGIGTLVQFDRDWRTGVPTEVVAASGPITPGQPLAAAVHDLLVSAGAAAEAVQCPTGAVAQAELPGTLCRARLGTDMVSIVATGHAGSLQVQAYVAS
ncbi:MAG TPA: hypothetical protein VF143_01455 [Candidatus Nanopelagicales bacterium]